MTARRYPDPPVIGTPGTPSATHVALLGSGEIGKEIAIALARLGVEVTAIDRYDGAPAQQVAHNALTVDMSNPAELTAAIRSTGASIVVPEIEALATDALLAMEGSGQVRVVPTARAVHLTMDREGIRRLAAEELGVPTSPYVFAASQAELAAGVEKIGPPCLVKPVMSSSGHGQTVIRSPDDVATAWRRAATDGRVDRGRVIVEGLIDFDTEITLLTVRSRREGTGGTVTDFCEPIGHRQEDGDYVESWQPADMSPAALASAQRMAAAMTGALADAGPGPGLGLFGAEFFVRGDRVWFSELSPRPHDTGMVTMATQDLNEFDLHARAILGLPVDASLRCPGASAVIKSTAPAPAPRYVGVGDALDLGADVRIFGKPVSRAGRRVGVVTVRGATVDEARATARKAAAGVRIENYPSLQRDPRGREMASL